jgi:hypothetical protein
MIIILMTVCQVSHARPYVPRYRRRLRVTIYRWATAKKRQIILRKLPNMLAARTARKCQLHQCAASKGAVGFGVQWV